MSDSEIRIDWCFDNYFTQYRTLLVQNRMNYKDLIEPVGIKSGYFQCSWAPILNSGKWSRFLLNMTYHNRRIKLLNILGIF